MSLFFLICMLCQRVWAQDSTQTANHFAPLAIDTSIFRISGEGFSYSVKKPRKWTGNTERAKDFFSNIVFYQNERTLTAGEALIQVLLFKKQDENTIEDLNFDVDGYKREYPTAKVRELSFFHQNYQCFAKVVYLKNKFYQYICYINPGKNFQNGFSVAMNIQKREATQQELLAYKFVIASLGGLMEH